MDNLSNEQSEEAVNDLQWLFTRKETTEGLYTEAELKRDPSLHKEFENNEWLSLTKHWGLKYDGYTPNKVDLWYQINWGGRTIAIEKEKNKAVRKFNGLADWLIEKGWEVSKTAGRA
jgi:hypothetical protein